MAKLNQIIAIEKGVKSKAHSVMSQLYKAAQKPDLFLGFSKKYQKKDEESEDLPAENKRVQVTADGILAEAKLGLVELFDITARKDWSNGKAVADVQVDGEVILADVPVTYLLFLEKQLTDLRTFIAAIPTLDESEDWQRDENSSLYKTAPIQTHRTRKAQKAIVLYDATEHHPAQTQLITEDVLAGYWLTVKQSGALPLPQKAQLVQRVEALLQAVKQAREEANGINEEPTPKVGKAIFDYVLGE